MKLNINLFGSGTITFTADGNLQGQIEWESTSNGSAANSSNVKATLYAKVLAGTTTGKSWKGYVKIGDAAAHNFSGFSSSKSISSSWVKFAEYNDTISHNLDGTKTITISGWVKGPTDTTLENRKSSGSASVQLETIPRSSEITNVYASPIPSYPNITWTPKSSSFKYMVRYTYNDLFYSSPLISPNTTSPYTYSGLQIPIDVFSGVSSSPITITAYLYTYDANGNPITPTTTKTFSVALTTNAKPTITIGNLSEADATMISKNWGIYVQGKSKLSFKVTTGYSVLQAPNVTTNANTNNQPFSFNGYTNKTYTTNALSLSGSKTITATATDSRNRTATATTTYNVVAYSNPTISTAQIQRCDVNGNIDKNGEYCYISYSASISSCDNHNKTNTQYKIGYREHNSGSYIYVNLGSNANSKSASGILSSNGISGTKIQFPTNSTYDIQFYVKDSFTTTTSVKILDSGFDLFNFNPSGKAMAIGKVSEASSNQELLEINLPTKIYGEGAMITLENTSNQYATQITMKRNDTGTQVYFGIGSGGYNRGMLDETTGKWIFMFNGTDAYVNEDKVGNTLKDTGWIKATLNNGYTHSALASAGDFMYRRIGNIVYTKGSVKGFTGTSQSCTQLPSGYRPATRIDFYASESGNYIAKFMVSSDGNVTILGGTRGSISDTQWYNICTSFVTDQNFPSS